MRIFFSFLVLMIILPLFLRGQDADRRKVLQVAGNYVEAMHEADSGLMDECLDRNFIKYGFYWKGSTKTFSEMTMLSRDQVIRVAKDWNRDKWVPDDAPREVDLLDKQEKIAVVKLTVFWGVEYLHLTKDGDNWKIVQALSQNWPKP